MTFITSSKNGCTYTLDGNHQTILMYHPLFADGSMESNRGAYEYVEWDELDDDVLKEADRCYALLKRQFDELHSQTTATKSQQTDRTTG